MFDNNCTFLPRARPSWAVTIVVAVLIAVVTGCTSPAKFKPASGSEKFSPYEGKVRVLENLPPSDQYKRVGVVMVEGVLLTKESDMIAAVKREAAENGADAVVMQSPVNVTKNSDGSTRKRLAAWAIRLNR
jgi:hypothetical protein